MRTYLFFVILAMLLVACSKSGPDDSSALDEKKLVGKVWKLGGTPPWVTMQFNSDKTGIERALSSNYPTVTYNEYSFTWMLDRDSIRLKFDTFGGAAFKVYVLKDSLLTMNNWVFGGVADTNRIHFRLY